MAETAKLHLVELPRRSLLRGAACAEGGARIMLLMSHANAAPQPSRQDVVAYQTSPKDDEAAAAKPS